MRESNFVTELRKSLTTAGIWSYKIADFPYSKSAAVFAPEKPCDIIAFYSGTFMAIECKLIKRWQSFGMRDLRPAQIRNLKTIALHGGLSIVALNVRIPRERVRWRFYSFNYIEEHGQIYAKELKHHKFLYYKNGCPDPAMIHESLNL